MYRKKHYAFLIFIFALLFMPSIVAHAEDIHLSHTLTGVTESTDTATVNLSLHVENTGVTAYNNLILSYVPITAIAVKEVMVNVASIEAGQSIDILINIVTPLPFEQAVFEQEPLFWGGEYDNPNGSGAIIEFPVKSSSNGGAL